MQKYIFCTAKVCSQCKTVYTPKKKTAGGCDAVFIRGFNSLCDVYQKQYHGMDCAVTRSAACTIKVVKKLNDEDLLWQK